MYERELTALADQHDLSADVQRWVSSLLREIEKPPAELTRTLQDRLAEDGLTVQEPVTVVDPTEFAETKG